MLFNSLEFVLLFLPITILLFFFLGRFGHIFSLLWLAIASLFFYAYWNILFLPILIGSILFNYAISKMIIYFYQGQHIQFRKITLIIGIAGNLLLLAYYKYADFFITLSNQITGLQCSFLNLILPLGISFFSFTQIAYLVDCYRGEVNEYNFLKYLLFVVYFPHLIAGPILHHKEMILQFSDKTILKQYRNLAPGLAMFGIGLFKKLFFADGIAGLANTMFADASKHALITSDAWMGAFAYTMQIYFDFSGYSDMAIGLSYLFGIRLPINFNSPYQSSSIIEFWRRWHMTLSRFLRDYLYIPLGGNRKGPIRRYINLLITMSLGGLWHGAGWTFLIWGALHGCYLALNHAWRYGCDKFEFEFTGKSYQTLSTILTFLCVTVAWIFFRASDIHTTMTYLRSMLGMQINPIMEHKVFLRDKIFLIILMVIAFGLPNSLQIMRKTNITLSNTNVLVNNTSKWYQWNITPKWGIISGFIFGILLIGLFCIGDGAEFLYFQF